MTGRRAAYSGADFSDFAECALRGIGLVVLQSNPLSGAFIPAALFLNSLPYGLACAVGTIVSTLAAIALSADKDMVREGLYGFNGALTGIALVAFTSRDFLAGSMPGMRLWLFIARCRGLDDSRAGVCRASGS